MPSRNPECFQLDSPKVSFSRLIYQKNIVATIYLVFYFSIYLYYYNARKKKQAPKGETNMKAVKRIEAMLNAYYETFKH